MLSVSWGQRKTSYDFVVIGSGYGGAINAARIASAPLNPKPSLCILERGREWPVGTFPDSVDKVIGAARSSANPLGLYEFLNYQDISVIKGSGLGGTSLINANVAIVPDQEVFELVGWPRSVNYDLMKPYYDRARAILAATPHPRALQLAKVQALDRRAQELGTHAVPLNVAVNFDITGQNPHGVEQKPCIDCGDCVTGCNVGAKNTLYMNYLPMARNAGAEIFTQTKVEWIEKLSGGGWRIHGRHYEGFLDHSFTLDAKNVILAAGSVNSTEILLRSEMHGLPVSPALGTGFSGNGDFFGLAYNGDYETDVLGYGTKRSAQPGDSRPPGPSIVGLVRYNGTAPVRQRIAVEDFSFPSAYVLGAKAAFALIRGDDTDVGDEDAERQRILADSNLAQQYAPGGALNHTMLYLVMGQDDARGTMVFEAPWFEPDGRMKIEWDQVGQQIVFTRMNEELRRHARALGASFISNPTWNVFRTRHLITAHPLGGCPMGEDYLQGAVDEFGRVFSGDGSVHDGLFVADGSVIPSALGVNPFLTISALAERIAERKVQQMGGNAYPQPNPLVSMSGLDPLDVLGRSEAELEKLFRRCSTQSIDVMINQGGSPSIDVARRTIRNDRYWKGFFPKGHILNAMSSAIFTGFKKEFHKQGLRYVGVTSDTDGRITARNSLEEITVRKPTGTLEAGEYILLRYLDIPWTGYYDVFKVINENLLIGRVYLGEFPKGIRLFTFSMTRIYGFAQMTMDDHRALFDTGSVPAKSDLNGSWRMEVVSNNNHLGGIAYLRFDVKPDGRLESRYQLMGLLDGLVMPSFAQDHFQLNDFTTFHDEIRKVDENFLVGRYVTTLSPEMAALLGSRPLGIFQTELDSNNFGFNYTLTRVDSKEVPTNTLLQPFLDVHLPDGLGMTFDEELVGWYFEGRSTPAEGRTGDLTIGDLIPASGDPQGAKGCRFQGRMVVRDLNEFVEGMEHEATIKGTLSFDGFQNSGPVTYILDERRSLFNYLRVNQATGEAEMRYHLVFRTVGGKNYIFEGRKYMQKDEGGDLRGFRDVLQDYTTLFCHVYEINANDTQTEVGIAYLKFRTFEDLAAVGSMTDFLRSFHVTGTDNPVLQLQGQLRFLAFTAQFVLLEYDPLSPDIGSLSEDVRLEVLRGAETPDYFSTRPSAELQTILHDTPTHPLETLLNKGTVRVDFEKKRIFRDSFWKGSFAKDSLLGWEERVRNAGLDTTAKGTGAIFAGGSFWKRFDRLENGVATGTVVNYELDFLPGDPVVTQVAYPDSNRRYFRKGDSVLLLNYRNHPYKMVYDTIKAIDENNAIGVMHLGNFPTGLEFATFVMARHNYPFEKMSVDDHRLIFSDSRTTVPTATQLQGTWEGSLIFLTRPNASLLNQANPVLFSFSFSLSGSQPEARYRFGFVTGKTDVSWTDDSVRLAGSSMFQDEIRMIDNDYLIGRSAASDLNSLLLRGLRNYLEPQAGKFVFYYVLKRTAST